MDLFTHFENKVLKTIWLTLRKPGFVTAENLRGVRVPYAKPVQLFIVVNLMFYLFVTYLHRTDYTPTIGDGGSSWLSGRPGLNWIAPLDTAIAERLHTLAVKKEAGFDTSKFVGGSFRVHLKYSTGTFPGYSQLTHKQLFLNAYDQRAVIFSKTMIFLLIPLFALVFYLAFPRKLKYYGAALNLSTHFLAFNLLLYILMFSLSDLPYEWTGNKELRGLPFKALQAILYNPTLYSFSEAVFGLYKGFEAFHVIFWAIWLFISFKRLFRIHWLVNLLASYLMARLFFILIFCLYKKFLIALSLWTL